MDVRGVACSGAAPACVPPQVARRPGDEETSASVADRWSLNAQDLNAREQGAAAVRARHEDARERAQSAVSLKRAENGQRPPFHALIRAMP